MDGSLSSSTAKLDIDYGEKKGKIFTKYFISALAAAILFLIITIGLTIAMAATSGGKSGKKSVVEAIRAETAGGKADVCITEACAHAASKIIASVDTTADPCDDFYQYSCGGWVDKTVIPEYRSSYSQFTQLNDEMAVQLKDLLEEDYNPSDPKPVLEAKDMYQACANKDKIEELGATPLRDLHTHLGGWPLTDPTWNDTEFDLLYTLSELRLLSNEYLVYVWVSADDRDSKTNIAQLDQFHLGLPHRKYYLEPEFSKEFNAYKTLIKEIAVYMGADNKTVDQDVSDVLEFETYMANISMKEEDRTDLHALYNRYKVSELYTKISDKFDWKKFMNLLFVDTEFKFVDDTEVVVYAPDFLKKMAEKVAVTPPRVLANYLVWRITEYRITNLPQAFVDIQNKFYRVAYSIPEEPPRWLRCVNYVNQAVGWAVGRLFVNKYFKEESKKSMAVMTEEVRQAFDGVLTQTEWMDPTTEKLAKEKLTAMNNHIGYPEWLYNNSALDYEYEGLEFEADTYFHNHLNWLKWIEINGFKRITKPVKKDRWFTAPAVIDAYYHHELNTMVLPAGVLQPPFWHNDQPMSLNYGGIVSFIGHAMTHGFDNYGRLFGKDGNVGQWWENKTLASFKEKTQCMIDQSSSYKVEEIDKYVNGENTLGENIADNGALKTSYEAFLKHEEKNGPGQRLPGLVQYSSKELFFLNFAQTYCRADRLSSLKWQVAAGNHSPGKWRVIGPVSNYDEFSKVFGCPVGSVMNPVDKCRVW